MHLSFSLLRVSGGIRRYGVTEAAGKRERGRAVTGGGGAGYRGKFGGKTAVTPDDLVWLFFLCPCSLRLLVNEGICGRFGRIGV